MIKRMKECPVCENIEGTPHEIGCRMAPWPLTDVRAAMRTIGLFCFALGLGTSGIILWLLGVL